MKQPFTLAHVPLPNFGIPDRCPELDGPIYRQRLARLRDAAVNAGFETILVYADREHFANLAYLCGVDPRFEEALLVVSRSGDPVLITGPENQGYSEQSGIEIELRLYPPFGLLGQDRTRTPDLTQLLRDCGLAPGRRTGVVGWKYFTPEEADAYDRWIEIPSYLADGIRSVVGPDNVYNATRLLAHPSAGLRSVNEVDQLAIFENAACHVSEAVKRVIEALEPGKTERELADRLSLGRHPLSCHPMISSGERTRLGLASPSDKPIRRGEPFQIAIGVWGALTCRAGWIAEGPARRST